AGRRAPSMEQLQARRAHLVGRTGRWVLILAGVTVAGGGGVFVAQRCGAGGLAAALAVLVWVCWCWTLLVVAVNWAALWLGLLAAHVGEVVGAAQAEVDAHLEGGPGGGRD